MDNKLSELSNPAWIVGQQEIADFMRGDEALIVRGHDPESTEPALRMYSQEYVSALLAEVEGMEQSLNVSNDATQVWKERAKKAEKQLVYSKDAIASWERKAISNFEECAKMCQRIEELEQEPTIKHMRSVEEALIFATDRASELEQKLATPVRLPALLQPESDAVNGMIFANGRNEAIAECSIAIRHAGFLSEASPMTVEGRVDDRTQNIIPTQ